MDIIDLFILAILGSMGIMLVFLMVAPPLRHLATSAGSWMNDAMAEYQFHWSARSTTVHQQARERRSQREFMRWLAGRVGGAQDEHADADILQAQELTPAIRLLIEEEIPGAIRRCNGIHRRLALLTGAIHMREIAIEPECIAMRRWTIFLLANTYDLLQQYPMSLKLESDDLLNASIVLRKNLVPTCSRCPYIRQTVSCAGERCSAAELIHIDTGPVHGAQQ